MYHLSLNLRTTTKYFRIDVSKGLEYISAFPNSTCSNSIASENKLVLLSKNLVLEKKGEKKCLKFKGQKS